MIERVAAKTQMVTFLTQEVEKWVRTALSHAGSPSKENASQGESSPDRTSHPVASTSSAYSTARHQQKQLKSENASTTTPHQRRSTSGAERATSARRQAPNFSAGGRMRTSASSPAVGGAVTPTERAGASASLRYAAHGSSTGGNARHHYQHSASSPPGTVSSRSTPVSPINPGYGQAHR